MKKLMLALLVGLMTVAFASIAAAEVTVGGSLETRYVVITNPNGNTSFNEKLNKSGANTTNFFSERVLLNVDAKLADGVEAFVELDTFDSERLWGAQSSGFGATSGFTSAMNYQAGDLHIKQAWVNFMVPGVPVGMKIGHQPLALGHGIFLDSHRMGQDAILLYSKPMPELLLAGVYVKSLENSVGANAAGLSVAGHKDVDVYAALANYTWCENNTVGAYYLYGHDASNVAGNFLHATPASVDRLHIIGVIADGTVSGVNYKGEVIYQNVNAEFAGKEMGVNNAWAAMAGLNTNVGPGNIGIEFGYGTGTDGTKQNAGSRTFITPYGTTSYNYAFLYNDKIGQGANYGFGVGGLGVGAGFSDGTGGFGLANTMVVKLSGSMSPMEKMKAGVDILYLRANEIAVANQSKELGWEIDANVAYQLYSNLDLNVQGGVFMPGSWYDKMNTVVAPATTPDTDTAYGAEVKLTAKF